MLLLEALEQLSVVWRHEHGLAHVSNTLGLVLALVKQLLLEERSVEILHLGVCLKVCDTIVEIALV